MERRSEGIAQQWKGRLRSIWGEITDDDVDRAGGNVDRLIGIIKEKTGEAEEKIRARIDEFRKDDDKGEAERRN